MSEHEQHQGAGGYEKRDVSVKHIAFFTILTLVLIVASVFMLNEYFIVVQENVTYELSLEPESPELIELKAYEDSVMTTYGFSDSTKTSYRIPIEKAMEIMANESQENKSGK